MKKIPFSLFIVALLLFFINTGCSKKSASPTLPHKILDTITVAGVARDPGDSSYLLYEVEGVWVDAVGDIYVADNSNSRVQKWIPGADSGVTIATVVGGGAPNGICLDKSGNLYVSDGVSRILKWAPRATFGVVVAGGATAGAAANQLSTPEGIWVDAMGYLYVSDNANYRIQKFPPGSTSTTNGVTIAGGNGYGTAANQLPAPMGLFVDTTGNVYVADAGSNYRVQKFPPGSTSATNGITVAGGNGIGVTGTGANQLNRPWDVAVDDAGYIYVSDFGNDRVQRFPPNSTSGTDGVTVAGSSTGIPGFTYDRLTAPTYIFLDAGANNLYIGDSYNDRVQKWQLK